LTSENTIEKNARSPSIDVGRAFFASGFDLGSGGGSEPVDRSGTSWPHLEQTRRWTSTVTPCREGKSGQPEQVRKGDTMTKAITPDTDAAAKLSADHDAPLPADCLRCGGPIEADGVGLKVFKESVELGTVCHDCTWDGNGHAVLSEDELEGWLHSVA
jgi:hypothetical protein